MIQNMIYIYEYVMSTWKALFVSGVIEQNISCISIRSSWLMLLVNFFICWIIICVLILLIIVKGLLKTLWRTDSRWCRVIPAFWCIIHLFHDLFSLGIIVDLLFFFFSSVSFCFMCFEGLFLSAYSFRILIPSWWTDPFIII